MIKLDLDQLEMLVGVAQRKIGGCRKRFTNVGFKYSREEQTDARRALPKWEKILATLRTLIGIENGIYCKHCGFCQPTGRKCQCWNDE